MWTISKHLFFRTMLSHCVIHGRKVPFRRKGQQEALLCERWLSSYCIPWVHNGLPEKGGDVGWPQVDLEPWPGLLCPQGLLGVPEQNKQTINFISHSPAVKGCSPRLSFLQGGQWPAFALCTPQAWSQVSSPLPANLLPPRCHCQGSAWTVRPRSPQVCRWGNRPGGSTRTGKQPCPSKGWRTGSGSSDKLALCKTKTSEGDKRLNGTTRSAVLIQTRAAAASLFPPRSSLTCSLTPTPPHV